VNESAAGGSGGVRRTGPVNKDCGSGTTESTLLMKGIVPGGHIVIDEPRWPAVFQTPFTWV
jgi:hypothetical protein